MTDNLRHDSGRNHASPARKAALYVLGDIRRREAFAERILEESLDKVNLSPEDHAFAARLVLGVIQTQGTLDEVIDRVLDNPDSIHPQVRDALRVSAYEAIYLGKDSHAVVDQGVELVKSVQSRAGGLANAVLRKIVKLRLEFPFGDPREDVAAFARMHAFPLWLTKEIIDSIGAQAAADLMKAANTAAPTFIAVNAARTDDDGFLAACKRLGIEVKSGEAGRGDIPGCYELVNAKDITIPQFKKLFARGMVLVSDAASQQVARIALPDEMPASFLEIGAGRATKTIMLQSNALRKWGSQMDLTTVDNQEFKRSLLIRRTQTYGTKVEEALTGDGAHLDDCLGSKSFDAVFLDAPCTGTGTLRRHPEIRWRLTRRAVKDSARLQLQMLQSAAEHVNAGGQLTYATCTVLRKENVDVVKAFLDSEVGKDFKLVPVDGASCFAPRTAPGRCDAHFCAVFRRK